MKLGDRSVRILLTIIAVLLAANLLAQWQPAGPHTAMAAGNAATGGLLDSGAQLTAIDEELQGVNKKLDKLQTYLESGALTVKVKDAKSDK